MAGGRSLGDGLLEQAPRQRVVGAREAGGEVEQPLRVPDALADAQQLLRLDRLAPRRRSSSRAK